MEKIAMFFRYSARFILLIVGILVFCFALISGANLDQGITVGIIKK